MLRKQTGIKNVKKEKLFMSIVKYKLPLYDVHNFHIDSLFFLSVKFFPQFSHLTNLNNPERERKMMENFVYTIRIDGNFKRVYFIFKV